MRGDKIKVSVIWLLPRKTTRITWFCTGQLWAVEWGLLYLLIS